MCIKHVICTISHCHKAHAASPTHKMQCWFLSNILHTSPQCCHTIFIITSVNVTNCCFSDTLNWQLYRHMYVGISDAKKCPYFPICWYNVSPLDSIWSKCSANHIPGIIIVEYITAHITPATHCIPCLVHEYLSSPWWQLATTHLPFKYMLIMFCCSHLWILYWSHLLLCTLPTTYVVPFGAVSLQYIINTLFVFTSCSHYMWYTYINEANMSISICRQIIT